MAQQPGELDGFGRHALGIGQLAQQRRRVPHCGVGKLGSAGELAAGQGRPGLHADVVQTAVVQRAGGRCIGMSGGVGDHAFVDQRQVQQADFHLVRHQRLTHMAAQQVDLPGRVVADAEVPHLAAGVQRIERARHFIRLHQRIGAVQQQDIQMVHAQARQAAFDRGHDMRVAEVVALRCARRIVGEADAALRLQDHLRAEPGRGAQHIAEHLFGLAARIDVGVVEQGDAVGQRRFDQPLRVAAFLRRDRRGIPGTAQMHAAVADAGGGGSIGQGVGLHRRHAQDGTGIMPEGCGASGQRSFAGEYPRQGIGFQRRG